jgi:hypothetical protein
MIGRLRGPHGSLGVCDGLIELTTLEEHLGEPCRRNRRRDGGRPNALGAQVALERDIPLEEGSRIAELASCEVCAANTSIELSPRVRAIVRASSSYLRAPS